MRRYHQSFVWGHFNRVWLRLLCHRTMGNQSKVRKDEKAEEGISMVRRSTLSTLSTLRWDHEPQCTEFTTYYNLKVLTSNKCSFLTWFFSTNRGRHSKLNHDCGPRCVSMDSASKPLLRSLRLWNLAASEGQLHKKPESFVSMATAQSVWRSCECFWKFEGWSGAESLRLMPATHKCPIKN